jgi:rubrerythrin
MLDFGDLSCSELLALGRHAMELCARRFEALAGAADSTDLPLRDLLRKMALDAECQAAAVEERENQLTEESRLPSKPEEAQRLIRSYLTSLSKSLGEEPLQRDAALFFAESLEEEAFRLFRVLAGHARESHSTKVFSDVADRERVNFQYLRDVVLQG